MSSRITLVTSPGLPSGFSLVHDTIDGKKVSYLRRLADGRQIEVHWIPGTRHYTAKELSAYLYRDGDDENPILKGYQ